MHMNCAVLTGTGRMAYVSAPRPTPGPSQLLVRVLATGICGSDLATFHGTHPYKTAPVVLGHELCGVVVRAAGEFAAGDLVCAAAYSHCGNCDACAQGRTNLCSGKRNLSHLGWEGSFAEYVVLDAGMTYRLPPGLDPVLGALVEPLSIGLHAVRLLGPGAGRALRIVGAGNIGLACLIAARQLGFGAITCSDLGPAKGERAIRLGADAYVDAGARAPHDGAGTEDAVVLASSHPGALQEALALSRPGGTVVVVSFFADAEPIMANLLVGRELTLIGSSLSRADDFDTVISWLAEGSVDPAPMVTHRLPLSGAAEAMRVMSRGGDVGKLILLPNEAA
jgi:threonine dehydrogenase-like Zn-dependent dehydrogenase